MLLNRSRGELGGKPFAQHCSCPAVLSCSVCSTVAAFRELLSYGRIASIAQGQALRSIGKAATSLLPPLTMIHLFSTQETLLQMSLWSRVRGPCAPAAQRADDSSSSRSRLAKSYGRFATLSLKQDCFFRVLSSKIKISLPGPPAADSVMIFQTPLRQLSKVFACFADA